MQLQAGLFCVIVLRHFRRHAAEAGGGLCFTVHLNRDRLGIADFNPIAAQNRNVVPILFRPSCRECVEDARGAPSARVVQDHDRDSAVGAKAVLSRGRHDTAAEFALRCGNEPDLAVGVRNAVHGYGDIGRSVWKARELATANEVADPVENAQRAAFGLHGGQIPQVAVDAHGRVARLPPDVVPEVVMLSRGVVVDIVAERLVSDAVDEVRERSVAARDQDGVLRRDFGEKGGVAVDFGDVVKAHFAILQHVGQVHGAFCSVAASCQWVVKDAVLFHFCAVSVPESFFLP